MQELLNQEVLDIWCRKTTYNRNWVRLHFIQKTPLFKVHAVNVKFDTNIQPSQISVSAAKWVEIQRGCFTRQDVTLVRLTVFVVARLRKS